MMTEMRLTRDGTTVASVQGDVSEDGDLARLYEILIAEFRRLFPNESLLDAYQVGWDRVTGGT